VPCWHPDLCCPARLPSLVAEAEAHDAAPTLLPSSVAGGAATTPSQADDAPLATENGGARRKTPAPPKPVLPAETDVIYVPKAICILSHWPFLDAFRSYLTTLYRLSLTPTPVCLERYICNLMHEIPLPPQGKIEVQVRDQSLLPVLFLLYTFDYC
jgi:hypothetical protein